MLRYIAGTLFYFQFEELYTKESRRGQKVPKVRILKIFVYICLSRLSIRKVCSVHFFRLQKVLSVRFFHYKSLQSAFLDYKSSKCLLFETIKVCRVCAFLLQKFVVSALSLLKFKVSAFLDYKGLQGVRFFTTKVCSVRFLLLQKFTVSAFWHYKSLQFTFLTQLVVSLTMQVQGDMVEGLT